MSSCGPVVSTGGLITTAAQRAMECFFWGHIQWIYIANPRQHSLGGVVKAKPHHPVERVGEHLVAGEVHEPPVKPPCVGSRNGDSAWWKCP